MLSGHIFESDINSFDSNTVSRLPPLESQSIQMSPSELQSVQNFELEKIKNNSWGFIHNGWSKFVSTKRHRNSPYKTYNRDKMRYIRDYLKDKLGILPVYYFLEYILKVDVDLAGPMRHIDKGLLLLFALVSGKSCRGMADFMPPSSFSKLQTEFYNTRGEIFEEELDFKLKTMFSSPSSRQAYSKLNNPKEFDTVTVIADGYDWLATTREGVEDYGNRLRYSRKLHKPGYRTQFIISCDNLILQVSDSEPCSLFSDNAMLIDMEPTKSLSDIDVLATDGGYHYNSKLGLKPEQLRKPFRKDSKKVPDSIADYRKGFNDAFSAFRGKIETSFKDFNQQFKYMDKVTRVIEPTAKRLNLKVKICALLRNIYLFQELYNVEIAAENAQWFNESFNFNSDEQILTPPEEMCPPIYMEFDKNLETTFFARYNIDKETGEVSYTINQPGMPQDLALDCENNSGGEKRYNVQKIVRHKESPDGSVEYYISWEGFSGSSNTWEPESSIDKEVVCKYLVHNYLNLNKAPPKKSMYYSSIVGQVSLFKYLLKVCNNKEKLLELCDYHTDGLDEPENKRARKLIGQ